ncbi:MAG: hypothetical protein JJ992_08260, partial [Planctomycetes bacterium]|nr:hypothetical protein [Planctomycetota bacterium]
SSFDPRETDVVVGFNETYICHFYNVKKARLTLVKKLPNDNGGTATEADFQANISGTGAPGDVDWNDPQILDAGTYTIKESTLAGYTPSGWSCDNDDTGPYTGTSVTLYPGDDVTCEITNDDQQAYIIVEKVVKNDNGGSAKPDDFKLTLAGNATTSGTKVPVDPGTYTADETLLSGYTFEGYSGDCDKNGDTTVALGQTKTCTLTNNDVSPTLTIRKFVVNGDHDADYFSVRTSDHDLVFDDGTLMPNGAMMYEAKTLTDLLANHAYGLLEENMDLYTEGTWSCDGNHGVGGDPAGGFKTSTVTLDLDEDVICWISNTGLFETDLVKTFNDVPNPLIDQAFVIYEGPDGFGGTVVESDTTLGINDGYLAFNDVKLDTTMTYTFCELEIPAGWSAAWYIDDGDTKGVLDINDTPLVPYNPNADDDPPEDVGNRCIDFGAGTAIELMAGETLSLIIDNMPPPGDTRTPGYWKNWSSCSNGNQFDKAKQEFLDEIVPRLHYSLDELLAQNIEIGMLLLTNSNGAPTLDPPLYPAATLEECEAAVNVLNSSDQSATRGKKPLNRSSDASYKLARSLLAYKLNVLAGAGSCMYVDQAALEAQCLLATGEETGCPYDGDWLIDGLEWNGEGSYLGPKDDADPDIVAMALSLHGILDDYNNFGCE